MTGMRAFTISVGLVDEPPPRAILRQKSRGLFRAAPKRPRRALSGADALGLRRQPAEPRSRRCPTGVAGGRGSGPLYGLVLWLAFELVQAPLMGLKQAKEFRPARARRARRRPPALRPGAVRDAQPPARLVGPVPRRPRPGAGGRDGAGRRLPARTSSAWRGELGVGGWVLNDERGVLVEVEGEERRWSTGSSTGSQPRRRRWPSVERVAAGRASRPARHGLRIVASERAGSPSALVSPGRGHLRGLPGASCSTRPTAATATRSSTAPTAGRASRSCAACPTTGRSTTMAGLRDVRRLPGRVRRPGRPPLPRPAQRVPGLRAGGVAADSDAARERARRAGRGGRALREGSMVAVKGLGGYHLACRADDEDAVGRAARAQAPRGQAVRADGAGPRRRPGRWWSSRPRRRSC